MVVTHVIFSKNTNMKGQKLKRYYTSLQQLYKEKRRTKSKEMREEVMDEEKETDDEKRRCEVSM